MEGRKDLQVAITAEAGAAGRPGAGSGPAADRQAVADEQQYRMLELYCQLTNTVWFVEAGQLAGGADGGQDHDHDAAAMDRRQLERPIQLSRKDEPLEVIVADLAHASGIRFVPEPGLYQSVPVVSLRSDNGTVLQTLEALAGATRISFEVRDDSVLLMLSPGPGNPTRGDTIVGRISVPVGTAGGADGTMMDVYIRESDLTAEQNQLRQQKIQEAVKALQKTWTTPAAARDDGRRGGGGDDAQGGVRGRRVR